MMDVNTVITDPTQASLMLEQRRRNVSDAYATLNKIVERHEATIQKRWLGKTRPARLKILLTAWPGMPSLHRPDFKAFRQIYMGNTQAAQWQRAAFKWPHINQEDLAKPRMLLLLLNARGRNHPRAFAGTDLDTLQLGMNTVLLGPSFSLGPDYLVKMVDASTPQEYGKLEFSNAVPFQPKLRFAPSKAFLVLEVQERILKFLASVCRLVLHDIPPSAMITDDQAYPVQPEPRLTSEASTGPFESIAAVAAEANYRMPGTPNIDQLESLLAARLATAKDRILALREDPGYFAAAAQDVYDHAIQQVKLSDGSDHPDLKSSNGKIIWAQAIKNIVATSYLHVEVYAELHMQSCTLRRLLQDFEATLSEGKSGLATKKATDEYVYALTRLRYYLRGAINGPLRELHQHFYSSPRLRDMFMILKDDKSKDRANSHGNNTLVVKPDHVDTYELGSSKANAASLLIWTAESLICDTHIIADVGIPSMLDETQRAMNQENIGSDMISPFVASSIGDMSVLAHCMRVMRRTQPFAYDVPRSVIDAVKKDFDVSFTPLLRISRAMDGDNVHGAASLVDPSSGRFAYPVDKRRTKETVEAMQRAELNLDKFWLYIDQVMHLKAGDLKHTAMEELLANPKARRRTCKWVEPSAALTAATAAMAGVQTNGNSNGSGSGKISGGGKKKKGGNKAAAKASANAAAAPVAGSNAAASTSGSEPQLVPLSPYFYDIYKSSPEAANGSNGSNRSDGSNESSTGSCYGSNRSREANSTPIKVDPRALKVFRALYFNPDGGSTFGEIPWNDFVNAMSSVGFHAEKMYGSLWHFRPTKQGAAGVARSTSDSIMFYEPYSQTKISFDGARWMGRHLTRAYGWNRDTFVAKGK
ncbi:hypothetical protein F503_02253 [Ophiostoma piceae UAMH 11346]|uniref:Ipa protein n=1 Tax=Ophiostoma piceae (strain UAMH 11346) TaxID=1262450 RepID=S3BW78_OPHP1|nr:hypothetical protein F503_02253 [Ophiostoma piceae UAMH 11346]